MVEEKEYLEHKQKCSKSFGDIFAQLDKMERAMFGEPDLKQKGVLEMTQEMYQSVMSAKGGERIFWILVKISGAVITIIAGFYALREVLKKIIS